MDRQGLVALCEKFLKETMEYNDIPGLVIGVCRGEDEWIGAAGLRDITDRDPLETGDVFHCASVSKLLTSTAVMKLVEEGRLRLDDRLADVLPDLKIRDERWKKIRIHQMLSHTSGLGDVEDYHWEKASTAADALREYVYSQEVADLPLLWEPGEGGFRYSNIAYEMLGLIAAERSEGAAYEDVIDRLLFGPAGMEASTMKTFRRIGVEEGEPCSLITERIRKENGALRDPAGPAVHGYRPMALPHEKGEDRSILPVKYYPYNREHAPSSTLTSTAEDLLKLGRFFLPCIKAAEEAGSRDPFDPSPATDGCASDAAPLHTGTFQWIIHEYATVPNNGEKMGLGWFMRKSRGYDFYGHEGTDDGFRASFWICPKLDLAIVVLGNLSGAPVKRISKKLFEELEEGLGGADAV